MVTLLIQLLLSLALSSLIVFTIHMVLTRRALKKRQVYLESFLEIIPRDAVSHYDRNVVEPKPPTKDSGPKPPAQVDVKVSQFIR
jgi:hypothetical protein